MKKLLTILSTTLLISSASAAELGVVTSRDWGGRDQDRAGLNLRWPIDKKMAFEAGVERNIEASRERDRYSLSMAYELARVGSIAIDGRFGAAYLRNKALDDGLMGTVGVGVRVPLTKTVNANAVLVRQIGHGDMSKFDTNVITLGLSYDF